MKNGTVIIDVAIGQGGCVETSRPATRRGPRCLVEGAVAAAPGFKTNRAIV